MFKDYWIKFGCFLMGYNYDLIKDSSEVSKKFVRKITSALLIISMIWSFIGFSFANRYLQLSVFGSIVSGLIMLIIIIQIERQIILTIKINRLAFFVRFLLGVIVAIIGATIIDQIFFKNDIENEKKDLISENIKKRTQDERNATEKVENNINVEINKKDSVINALSAALAREPQMVVVGRSYVIETDTTTHKPIRASHGVTYTANPKIAQRDLLYLQRHELVDSLNKNQKELLAKITQIKKDKLAENAGFLEELTVMLSLVKTHVIALIVYLLWFSFFVLIEIFIVIAKWTKEENDYDRLIRFQEKNNGDLMEKIEKINSQYYGKNKLDDETNRVTNKKI